MKVTIITVCYNSAKTIEKTIQSVIAQGYDDLEYIIIDGGSQDGTLDIIRRYETNVTLLVSEPDYGIYDAMNKGIMHASGDIIGIINSDDWYETGTVAKTVKYFENNDVDVTYGRISVVDSNGEIRNTKEQDLITIWFQMAVPHPSVFIKRDIYVKYGFFDTTYKIVADYELILRLYSKGVKFGYINDVLAYFRKGGISQRQARLNRLEGDKICHKYIAGCEDKEHLLPLLKECRGWAILKSELEDNSATIQEALNLLFQTKVTELVIFGAGNWGRICHDGLQNIGIEVKYFIDNYAKEKQQLCGKAVKKFVGLDFEEMQVLIAVKDSIEEIKKQCNLQNIKKYVSIHELMDVICRKYLKM